MGETCVIAILLGLAYLLFTHTIEFTIPASIVGTMYVLTLLATRRRVHCPCWTACPAACCSAPCSWRPTM